MYYKQYSTSISYLWCSVSWCSLHFVSVHIVHQTVIAEFSKLGGTSLEDSLLEGIKVGQFDLILALLGALTMDNVRTCTSLQDQNVVSCVCMCMVCVTAWN